MENLIFGFAKIAIATTFIVLTCLYLYFRLIGSKYFARRNIPHLKPVFLLGNFYRANFVENFGRLLMRYHMENKKSKILGFWFFFRPSLILTDLDILRRILIRDFNNFRDRGIEVDLDLDPLLGHLFSLKGKKWRNLRVRLTPTFTSGKMKMMFPTMAKCGRELQEVLKKPAETGECVEVKDVLARYATDVISSCAFGMETNSLQNPKSEFREFGKKIFKADFKSVFINMILVNFPKFMKLFGLKLVPKDISDFFIGAVRDNIEYRERTNTKRNDFLQLLIQLMRTGKIEDIQLMRTGKIEDVDKTPIDGLTDEELVQKFSLNEAAAQCFIFFLAGFDTSSTAMSFGLYEMALNPDIQKRLQDEIDSTLADCDGDITYDTLQSMEYLDMVVNETLRKYPPAGTLQRQCGKDYYIPELDFTIEKGTPVTIPVWGIHLDPDIYPNPDKFDPERFTPEEKAKRDTCAFLPFGEGPRNCIGNRFALMQIKMALFYVMSAYDVVVTKTTPIPLKLKVSSIIPNPVGGMNLVFRKRQNI
ncbi:UNVERIFIED_CONTAM: hypothetical protein PYX00_007706 [Menopon gallinae]|uniref:Cytochrome P450 n=1 Tax=Menopon gallinae TaxID=328185 RepID=A0AAW2HK92_9NEOP